MLAGIINVREAINTWVFSVFEFIISFEETKT